MIRMASRDAVVESKLSFSSLKMLYKITKYNPRDPAIKTYFKACLRMDKYRNRVKRVYSMSVMEL
jgi:hypothetical protein